MGVRVGVVVGGGEGVVVGRGDGVALCNIRSAGILQPAKIKSTSPMPDKMARFFMAANITQAKGHVNVLTLSLTLSLTKRHLHVKL